MTSEKFSALARRIRRDIADLDDAVAAALDATAEAEQLPRVRLRLIESAALNVQGAYTVVEEIFRDILVTVDEDEPRGADWHQALLRRIALDEEGIRPAVIGPRTLTELRGLLAFRHVARAAYGARLDPDGVIANVQRLEAIFSILRDDLLAFAGWLEACADE